AVELPLAEPEHVRGHSEVGDATQHAHEVGRRVGDTLGGDGDVVELDPGHWRRSVRYRTMKTRLGIIGAGAIGCVVGGLLTKAGHDVSLIDQWPEHVETMRRRRLRLTGTCGDHTIAVKAFHLRVAPSIAEPLGFKVGEHDGRDTERARRIAELLTAVAGAKVTTNLWGERWSKLAVNCMLNPLAGLSGLGTAECRTEPGPRRIAVHLGAEVV